MVVKPRAGFEFPVKIIDAVNPFLVIVSIVGLFFEYTPFKSYVIPANQVIDVLFVIDFITRLICFPTRKYFMKGYGWVDFLASLPGITLLLQYTPMFAVFKFVRIGRFFKIIRVLRFLRVFNFLKKMKSDSVFVQERIMKIGVSVVLVYVLGLVFVDIYAKAYLEKERTDLYIWKYEAAGNDPAKLAAGDADVAFYSQNGKLSDRSGKLLSGADYARYDDALNGETHWFLEVPFQKEYVLADASFKFPREGILVKTDDLMLEHDNLMLILISTLVVLLFFIIFYVGYVLAKDMKVVHLIVDSIDAEDHLLLKEEAKKLRDEEGGFVLEEGEDEMRSLMKMAGKLVLTEEEGSSYLGGLNLDGLGTSSSVGNSDFSEVNSRLDRLEDLVRETGVTDSRLREVVESTVKETVRFTAPAIIKYLKQLQEK